MALSFKPAPKTDQREHEGWFLRLPTEAKEEFRKRFRKEGEPQSSPLQQRERLIQCLIDASIVFLPVELICFGLPLWSFLVVAVMSVVLGLLWFHTSLNRTLCVLAVVVPIRVLCGTYGFSQIVFSWIVCGLIARATTFTRETGRVF